MTVILVNTKKDRLNLEQRRFLAEKLTDAVLVPEIGQLVPLARRGFQVHFIENDPDKIAIGGKLIIDQSTEPDVILINILVMDSSWPDEVRAEVIKNILAKLAEACGVSEPPATWWVTFQVVDEGSWGSGQGVLSIFDLLNSGAFSSERVEIIRRTLNNKSK